MTLLDLLMRPRWHYHHLPLPPFVNASAVATAAAAAPAASEQLPSRFPDAASRALLDPLFLHKTPPIYFILNQAVA